MWAWIEVILLWSFKGVTLNLLRPGDNKKSLGFYGGGGVCKLFEEVCTIHMTEIIKNYCIGAARFWRAQAIPPNKLCSCFGFVCAFLFSGHAKNFSGVPHLPWRCRRPCWPKQQHWMQQPIAKLTSPGHALPREPYFLPWGKHWKGKKNWIRIQYLALPRHWTEQT